MSVPSLSITIPWTPPTTLSPNGRAHWRRKAEAAADARLTAKLATLSAMQGTDPPFAENTPLRLTWRVTWPKRRGGSMPDLTNLIASTKNAEDGVFDALGLDDRLVVAIAVEQERGTEKHGWTMVRIEEAK